MAKKVDDDGANSGIWKMVYADFTTAMMAFFLILWLANTASDAERDLLADYFNPISISRDKSGSEGVLSGKTNDSNGSQTNDSADSQQAVPVAAAATTQTDTGPSALEDLSVGSGESGADDGLAALEQKLRVAFEQRVDPLGLNDVVYVERRDDAVYIQIHDDRAFSMFDVGQATLTPQAQQLFVALGEVLRTVPNVVRIAGHTDASGFRNSARGNWELSSERANAARRVMESAGLQADRIEAVEGRGSRELFVPARPEDPRNRRITVSVHANVAASGDLLFSRSQ
ncbi:OmpA family protein [Parvularcula lutaonensis]|uniref:OmpA family protein n=1 Tax=Parvularcula lutaonensis TaxID=491923 RepID=A0ABV7MCR3_9PROT|nr:OmpA family protein [Parvularcula lutaonensis]GGY50706.1 chemotaxis protein MotB [Parvularcula lutaonensis]